MKIKRPTQGGRPVVWPARHKKNNDGKKALAHNFFFFHFLFVIWPLRNALVYSWKLFHEILMRMI